MLLPLRATGILLAAGVLLGGCGDDKPSVTSPTSMELVPDKVSEADIAFAQALRSRHVATAALAALGQRRATDSRVQELAAVINQVHLDEAKLLDRWLADWKTSVDPTTKQAGAGGVLTSLEGTAPGPAFDRAFLGSLITQMGGSIPIAEQELRSGSTVSALNLAERIVEEQPGEIEEMQGLLSELP